MMMSSAMKGLRLGLVSWTLRLTSILDARNSDRVLPRIVTERWGQSPGLGVRTTALWRPHSSAGKSASVSKFLWGESWVV